MSNKWAERFGSEWQYIIKLGSCFSDPEEKKAFWEMVKAKKEENEAYSIYTDFPTQKEPKTMAQKYCGEILEMLRGRKKEESA